MDVVLRVIWVDIWVAFAWIFFRAGSFADLSRYMRTLFACNFKTSTMALFAAMGPMTFVFCLVAVALLAFSYVFPRDCRFATNRAKFLYVLSCMVAIVLFAGPSGGEFIYFQF